jgi:hypothetical protein
VAYRGIANGVPLGCAPFFWDAATEEVGGGAGGTTFGVAVDEGVGGVLLAVPPASDASCSRHAFNCGKKSFEP